MEDRHQTSDYYRQRDRSPTASRYRDRSSERYGDRARDRYRSSRYRDRSRSGSYSRSSRRSDRYRSKSRSRGGDRRSSRSRSPRRRHHHVSSSSSSRYNSSRSNHRHHRRSRSSSSSSSPSRRSSPHNNRIPPPPPSFPKLGEHDDDDYTNCDPLDTHDTRPVHNTLVASSSISPTVEPVPYSYNGVTADSSKSAESFDAYENDAFDEPIDKERIHREMEEKLRLALAKEGKIYPPPKPEPSHPVFANDGSFLEIFKKMQQQMTQPSGAATTTSTTDAAAATEQQKLRNQPICKRRGGKILKTGIVAKTRTTDASSVDPKDFWSIYLQEVKKYKNTSCDVDSKTRPLVK